MPANDYSVSFRVGADTTGLVSGFNKAESEQTKFVQSSEAGSKQTSEAVDEITSSFNRLTDAITKVGAAYTALDLATRLGSLISGGGFGRGIDSVVIAGFNRLRTVISNTNKDLRSFRDVSRGDFFSNLNADQFLNNASRASRRIESVFSRITSLFSRFHVLTMAVALDWDNVAKIVTSVYRTLSTNFPAQIANLRSYTSTIANSVRSLRSFTAQNLNAASVIQSSLNLILTVGSFLTGPLGIAGGVARGLISGVARAVPRMARLLLDGIRGAFSAIPRLLGGILTATGIASLVGFAATRERNTAEIDRVGEDIETSVYEGSLTGLTTGLSDGIVQAAPILEREIEKQTRDLGKLIGSSLRDGIEVTLVQESFSVRSSQRRFGILRGIFFGVETPARALFEVFVKPIFAAIRDVTQVPLIEQPQFIIDFVEFINSTSSAVRDLVANIADATARLTGLYDAIRLAREFGRAARDLVEIFTLPELIITGLGEGLFGSAGDIERSLESLLGRIRAEYARLRAYFEGFLSEVNRPSAREELTQRSNDPRSRFAQAEEDLAIRYARKRDEEIRKLERNRIRELQAEFFPDGIAAVRAQTEGVRDRFAQATSDFQARARSERTDRLIEEFFGRFGGAASLRGQNLPDPRSRFAQAEPDFLARAEAEAMMVQNELKDFAEQQATNLLSNLTNGAETAFNAFISGPDAGDFGQLGKSLLNVFTSSIIRSFSAAVFKPIFDGIGEGLFGAFSQSLTNIGLRIGQFVNQLLGGLFSGAGGLFGGIASILGFQTGGIVPGPQGAPQIAVVHGGETVFTPEQLQNLGGQTILNFNIQGDVTNQTRQQVYRMLPEITTAVQSANYSRGLI